MSRTIHQGELDHADVQSLLATHVAAMRAQSPEDACHVLPGNSLRRPEISFFSLREDGRLLGIGALRALPNHEGEVKSMRTAPGALGRGVGKTILRAIVAEALARGYRCLRLETGGSADFEPALALYRKAGFVEGEAFGGYPPSPFTLFLRLDLPVSESARRSG